MAKQTTMVFLKMSLESTPGVLTFMTWISPIALAVVILTAYLITAMHIIHEKEKSIKVFAYSSAGIAILNLIHPVAYGGALFITVTLVLWECEKALFLELKPLRDENAQLSCEALNLAIALFFLTIVALAIWVGLNFLIWHVAGLNVQKLRLAKAMGETKDNEAEVLIEDM
ncbi:hypothetical protein G7Y89_g2402 [Cudoniella acicularis]|uniref:Uncharacterized protein n=1 Tax=Cudoniella acicularis TaxID=354080 RepID=A0A8H4W8N8_9HELO|nr:hypothetical protein G7Y89_g2402 [Cudoniella acicularis]